MLSAAHKLQGSGVPLMGLNLGDLGYLTSVEATRIEGVVIGALSNVLLAPSPPDASSVNAVVNRSVNVISTENLDIAVQIVPKAQFKTITETIGYSL